MAGVVMTPVLLISILIRLVAVGLSVRLLYRILDWRVGFLAVMLVLMTYRQILTLLAQPKPWTFSFIGSGVELPGLAVSGMALLAVFFVGQTMTDLKRAEETLRENELRLKLALDSAHMGVWTWTLHTNAVHWSPECFEICGVTSFTGDLDGFTKMVHPEDLGQVMGSVNRAITDRTIFECEFRFIRPDGSVRWLSNVGQVEYDAGGRPRRVVGTVQDITARKQTEEEIKKSELMLVESQRLAGLGSWEWNISTNHVEWSKELYRVLGYTPEEREGNLALFLQTVHSEDRERVNGIIQQSLISGRPFSLEYRIVWPGETIRIHYAHGEVVLGPEGRPIRIYGFAQDITERKRAEEALRVSRELLNNIIDSSPSYIFAIDLRHRYILANSALAQLFGMPKDKILGKTEHDAFPKNIADRLAAANDEIMTIGTPQHIEEVVESKSGGLPRVVSTVKFPLRDAEGKICGLGGVATDITERKRAEDALRDSVEQLQVLTRRLVELQESERRRISGELHDEVGQILAGIKLTLETNLSSLDPPVRTSLAEAVNLVDDLISRVRDLSLDLRPSMLDDLGLLPTLKWHIDRYVKQTRVDVHFQHVGIGRRFGSEIETAAYRIIQEALTNVALHAHVKEVSVRCESKDNIVQIEIEDHGAGFNPSSVGRTSPGLSGMQERAVVLGGIFTIDSAPGMGTRVTVRIPYKTIGTEGNEGL